VQGVFGHLEVAGTQGCRRLTQRLDEVVEDRVCRPLHEVPGIAREHGPHPERHASAEERLQEAFGRPARGRGIEHYREQRRHARLGDERRPAPEQPRHGHRQRDDDPYLDRPRPDEHHQQIRYRKPARNPEDKLEYPTPLLPHDNPRGDNCRYGREVRLAVPEHRRSQKPRQARRHRCLQYGPNPDPQPAPYFLRPAP
jgi:hypothetical protein